MLAKTGSNQVDVEFSLALHLKTGKYFHGRDLIAATADRIHRQLFWRLALNAVPGGLTARVIGRLLAMEVGARVAWPAFDRLIPRIKRTRPVAHMDPHTTAVHQLAAHDLVLCHDVGPLTHPELFDVPMVAAYEKIYQEIARVGPHMVFVSVASQSEFHKLFKGPYASSRVIYPPLRNEVVGGVAAAPAGVGPRFLLTVGSVGARKNQLRAIQAFAQSGLAAQGVQYVLCGGKEPGYEAVAAAAAQTPGVVLLGFVTDLELNWLYENAAGFVLPSLLEGFGVPVAEAVARGLVPLVSADSVLHEVAGDGALLVDPMDTAQIAAGMRALVEMSKAEAEARHVALVASLAKFSPEVFEQSWREAIEAAIASA